MLALWKDTVSDKDQVDDVGHFRSLRGTVASGLSIDDSTVSSAPAPCHNPVVVENSSFDSLCLASQRIVCTSRASYATPFERASLSQGKSPTSLPSLPGLAHFEILVTIFPRTTFVSSFSKCASLAPAITTTTSISHLRAPSIHPPDRSGAGTVPPNGPRGPQAPSISAGTAGTWTVCLCGPIHGLFIRGWDWRLACARASLDRDVERSSTWKQEARPSFEGDEHGRHVRRGASESHAHGGDGRLARRREPVGRHGQRARGCTCGGNGRGLEAMARMDGIRRCRRRARRRHACSQGRVRRLGGRHTHPRAHASMGTRSQVSSHGTRRWIPLQRRERNQRLGRKTRHHALARRQSTDAPGHPARVLHRSHRPRKRSRI